MSDLLDQCLARTEQCNTVFAKFLSPNDTGLTGGHQCGIYIPKQCVRIIFDGLFPRGKNEDRWADINWNEGVAKTHSRFTYYGQGTRDEYRITNFGRGFSLLKPDHTGDLIVLCKESEGNYWAYEFSTEEEIEDFLDAYSVIPSDLNKLLKDRGVRAQIDEDEIYHKYVITFNSSFPTTAKMAEVAEEIDREISGNTALSDPDATIMRWTDVEYKLFRAVEDDYYSYVLEKPMDTLEDFVKAGLEITNRRKSRAGKSLEHHLASIFSTFGLQFSEQAITEDRKKPDFIFPSETAYHDPSFPAGRLTFLGAKTTCKDRWRQVLNEANRIPHKYLFTLQPGVSPAQMQEMADEGLTLVVPKPLHKHYPSGERNIISLRELISIVQSLQGHSKQ